MGHTGMKFSLPSRELIADSVEIMAEAHAFDGLVFIPNCDKVVPGMLMASVRLNLPSVFVSGGPMLAGQMDGAEGFVGVDVNSIFERWGESPPARCPRRSSNSSRKLPVRDVALVPACSPPIR